MIRHTAGLLFAFAIFGHAQEKQFDFDPAQSFIGFTLPATLHTVHGSFQLKHGNIRFDPATGAASGEVVVDATSGISGNTQRDTRMHKSILETPAYPEIVFRPDHINGQIPTEGAAAIEIHGMFSIHGSSHELTFPVQIQMAPQSVSLTARFKVPYIKWGIKNPSTFLLRVGEQVEIELHATGHLSP